MQSPSAMAFDARTFGVLLQYPDEGGRVDDLRAFIARAHDGGALVAVATDLLALVLLTPPGEMGADVVFGNSQRFGVPLGCGGPHAAFFAVKDDYVRHMPGRIIGVSVDAQGKSAYRMALQTREQHIRREKATSNICTAQALLANMAAMYAVYHGPRRPARDRDARPRSHAHARRRAAQPRLPAAERRVLRHAARHGRAPRRSASCARKRTRPASISATSGDDARRHRARRNGDAGRSRAHRRRLRGGGGEEGARAARLAGRRRALRHPGCAAADIARSSRIRSSTRITPRREMMRYMKSLERKDIGLDISMIPLGSCTMKLNAASEMYPVSWPEFSRDASVRARRSDRRATSRSSTSSQRRCARSPALPPSRCSRTPARRASSPASK